MCGDLRNQMHGINNEIYSLVEKLDKLTTEFFNDDESNVSLSHRFVLCGLVTAIKDNSNALNLAIDHSPVNK